MKLDAVWCALNGYCWPWEVDARCDDKNIANWEYGAMSAMMSLISPWIQEAGLKLWSDRVMSGCDPVTGKPSDVYQKIADCLNGGTA